MSRLFRAKNIDMTQGSILSTIITFGLPIFLGNVFQQLYNMVDSIVVGKYVSANALAAVGSTATITMVLVGIMNGFPTGAAVVAAQFLGAGRKDRIRSAVSTTLVFLLLLAVVLAGAGIALSSNIITWMHVPDEIRAESLTYFRIYLLGMLFMAMYNFFAAFLRAFGDSTTPLIFLIISSLLNIAGDLFFVLKLNMGVAGVAWATVIAQGVSVVLCFIYVGATSEYFHFKKGEPLFDKTLFGDIMRLGLPTSIQGSITSLGMVLVQSLINSFGAVSMAAYTAANRMEQLCNLPAQGLSMALSMFVGQNIGARNITRSEQGLRKTALACVCVAACASLVIYLFGPKLMLLFVNESDIDVIDVGVRFMHIWAPLVFLHALCECVVSFLRGAGDSYHSMISMFFDLGVRTIMAYLFARGLSMGFMGIAWAIPCGWMGCCIYSGIRYFTGGWKKKAVV